METKQKQAGSNESKLPAAGAASSRKRRAAVIDPWRAVYQGHYDLSEFIARYGLIPMEAREIFARIGPARNDLDQYMNDRGKRSS